VLTIDGMVTASLHRPLRVCMVTGYRPTLSGGGMEKHVYELVGGLRRRGIEVEIICEDRSFLPDAANELAHCIIGVEPDSLHATGWTALYREKLDVSPTCSTRDGTTLFIVTAITATALPRSSRRCGIAPNSSIPSTLLRWGS
jgi:hypothetical protein